ncbi:hypothetical protein Tco_0708489, partial [Tanacetum coccineum]
RKKYWGSNIGDSGNTRDEGKTVDGAIGTCGSGIGESLLVALYACMTFIYGSSWKSEMASEAKRYLVKSSEELGEVPLPKDVVGASIQRSGGCLMATRGYEGVVPKVVSLGDQVVYLGVVSKAGGVVAKMLEWCPRVLLLEKG